MEGEAGFVGLGEEHDGIPHRGCGVLAQQRKEAALQARSQAPSLRGSSSNSVSFHHVLTVTVRFCFVFR